MDNSFKYLKENIEKFGEGIVVMGAGGSIKQWVEGISSILIKEQLIQGIDLSKDLFPISYKLTGNKKGEQGRTDIVLFFSKDAIFEKGLITSWMMRFGNVEWVNLFLIDYKEDYEE